jgi:hypothetical protein
MNIIRKGANWLLLVLIISGCGKPAKLPPVSYVHYLEDQEHELVRKVIAGDYEYTIQLATPEYMACKGQAADSSSGLSARIAELKGHLFFIVKMNRTEQKRMASGTMEEATRHSEADALVAYYDQQAAQDITLETGTGSNLHPVTYHFEQNYGLAPYNTMIAGFETGPVTEDISFVFNDRLRNIPQVRASFSKSVLQELPQLTY